MQRSLLLTMADDGQNNLSYKTGGSQMKVVQDKDGQLTIK